MSELDTTIQNKELLIYDSTNNLEKQCDKSATDPKPMTEELLALSLAYANLHSSD